MKLTKKQLKKIIRKESFVMSDEKLSIVTKILSKEIDNLNGKVFSTTSGGGCCHTFFQLKDFHWIGFHNTFSIDKPSITSKPFKTIKSLERAFFEDEGDEVTSKDF